MGGVVFNLVCGEAAVSGGPRNCPPDERGDEYPADGDVSATVRPEPRPSHPRLFQSGGSWKRRSGCGELRSCEESKEKEARLARLVSRDTFELSEDDSIGDGINDGGCDGSCNTLKDSVERKRRRSSDTPTIDEEDYCSEDEQLSLPVMTPDSGLNQVSRRVSVVAPSPSGSPRRDYDGFEGRGGNLDEASSSSVGLALSDQKGQLSRRTDYHLSSLRLEASLLPFRPLLARLMSHSAHNRRGTFNTPVDHIALGLKDYGLIVPDPMDLGTVKARLHSCSYRNGGEVADDIRLVFRNAMRYNPPGNPVHDAAKALLEIFEAGYESIVSESLRPFQKAVAAAAAAAEGNLKTSSFAVFSGPSMEGGTLKSEISHPASMSMDSVSKSIPSGPGGKCPAMVTRSCSSGTTTSSSSSEDMEKPAAATKEALSKEILLSMEIDANPTAVGASKCPPRNVFAGLQQHSQVAAFPLPKHSCSTCLGRTCALCDQGCLALEPTLLTCAGPQCAGTKIRKGATYFSLCDGTKVWCQRCYSNLPAMLPNDGNAHSSWFKRDLLKRKNDGEVVEGWVDCTKCQRAIHQVCAMYNTLIGDESSVVCPMCSDSVNWFAQPCHEPKKSSAGRRYTFVSGTSSPEIIQTSEAVRPSETSAVFASGVDLLPSCRESSFIQRKVQERMMSEGCPPNAEQTVSVRIISNCSKHFRVPDVVRKHFRMQTEDESGTYDREGESSADSGTDSVGNRSKEWSVSSLDQPHHPRPPKSVRYQSKAIALFQNIDGADVCIFCMYVQEYDSDEEYTDRDVAKQKKRVYVAYLDSVEHFRPRSCRTSVYHEILVSYLAAARARGFESAHIWACPPSRGNSFVFWSHPSCQRTPTLDRLVSWYHGALSRAAQCGIVTDVRSLYEVSFQKYAKSESEKSTTAVDSSARCSRGVMVCPPLLDGDYWIEEAVRAHSATIARHVKKRSGSNIESEFNSITFGSASWNTSSCPAIHVAAILTRVLAHPSSMPFRRPVNAVALKLHDYHDVISKPMDLGTVHSRLLLGELNTLREAVSDVELVFQNAMRYNPKGHVVHGMAVEMRNLFFSELRELSEYWTKLGLMNDDFEDKYSSSTGISSSEGEWSPAWTVFGDMSMRLSVSVQAPQNSETASGLKQDIPANESTNASTKQPACAAATLDGEVAKSSPDIMDSSLTEVEADSPVACAGTGETSSSTIPSILSTYTQHGSSSFPETFGESSPSEGRSGGKLNEVLPIKRVVESSAAQAPSKRAKTATSKNSSAASARVPSLDILTEGPDAIAQRMVGSDAGLFSKKYGGCIAGSGTNKKKTGKGKRKKKSSDSGDDASNTHAKQRKESWLGDEVGAAVRQMRRNFFVCDLTPKKNKSDLEAAKEVEFMSYLGSYLENTAADCTASNVVNRSIADTRHGLLEFFQYHNFQFDTLRRAKYSTAMLIFHLIYPDARAVPVCTSCNQDVSTVRWHKVKKAVDERGRGCMSAKVLAKIYQQSTAPWTPEELCQSCYTKASKPEEFIPLQVSFNR